jgi:hypothetical protein
MKKQETARTAACLTWQARVYYKALAKKDNNFVIADRQSHRNAAPDGACEVEYADWRHE